MVCCERLRQLRIDAGLTQDKLAEKLFVHVQTVSKWERGLIEPDISILGKLAETLGVSLEKLLGFPESEIAYTGTFNSEKSGRALSEKRLKSGKSQTAVSSAVGISADTLSRWERGITCPSANELCLLAKYYNASISELYYGTDETDNETLGDDETPENSPAGPIATDERRKKSSLPTARIVTAITLAVCLILSILLVATNFNDKVYTVSVDDANYRIRHGELFSPAVPERRGYDFAGWIDEDGNAASFPTSVEKNCRFTAVFSPHEYYIDYWLNGGTLDGTPPTSFSVESDAVELQVPTKPGAVFLGWFTSPTYEGECVNSLACRAENAAVYAKWDKVVYSIKYDLRGGSCEAGNPTEVTSDAAEKLNPPHKVGYTFVGWFDEKGETEYEFVGGSNAKNMTLYAFWQKSDAVYTIEYDYCGGEPADKNPETIREGESLPLAPATKRGHDFQGYNDRSDGNGNFYTRLLDVTGNLRLYAIFLPKEYIVVYRYDGSYVGESNPNKIRFGETVTLKPVELHGYVFDGWYTKRTGGTKIDEINEANVTEISELFAVYTPVEYKVTLDPGDGVLQGTEKSEYTLTVESKSLDLPSCVRQGYDFLGWFDDEGKKYETITASNLGNLSLTAKWRPSDKTYSITYVLGDDFAGHDNPAQFSYSKMLVLKDAFRSGYEFLGWRLGPDGEIVGTIAAGNENDVTLYAVWQIVKEYGTSDFFDYEKTIDGVTITGYKGEIGSAVSVVVPSKIDGEDVVSVKSIITDDASTAISLKRLVLPDGVTSLGKLFARKTIISEPLIVPATVKELGAYCFDRFSGRLLFAENSILERINEYALGGEVINTIIVPDSVTYAGRYAFGDRSCVVLPKNLVTLDEYAVGRCLTVFFAEGIGASLKNVYAQNVKGRSWAPSFFCSRADEQALQKIFATAYPNLSVIGTDKVNVEINYGNRTETINDYYSVLPLIHERNATFVGWIAEVGGKKSFYNPGSLFVPGANAKLRPEIIERSEHDGLTQQTAAEIDLTSSPSFTVYVSSTGDCLVPFYFRLKTDTPVYIRIEVEYSYTGYPSFQYSYKSANAYDYSKIGQNEKFLYSPGSVFRFLPYNSLAYSDGFLMPSATMFQVKITIIDL